MTRRMGEDRKPKSKKSWMQKFIQKMADELICHRTGHDLHKDHKRNLYRCRRCGYVEISVPRGFAP